MKDMRFWERKYFWKRKKRKRKESHIYFVWNL